MKTPSEQAAAVKRIEKAKQAARRPHESTTKFSGRTLALWRDHCEQEHGATFDDYRMNVRGWHERNYPDCQLPRLEQ